MLVAVYGRQTVGATEGTRLYLFDTDLDGYGFDPRTGKIDLCGVAGGSWYHPRRTVSSSLARSIRRTYAAGYDPVPNDLRSACGMLAIAIREASKVAGPVQQQGLNDRYYTVAPTVDIPAPARAILDRYADEWGVA